VFANCIRCQADLVEVPAHPRRAGRCARRRFPVEGVYDVRTVVVGNHAPRAVRHLPDRGDALAFAETA
jgi:hypothetical protein